MYLYIFFMILGCVISGVNDFFNNKIIRNISIIFLVVIFSIMPGFRANQVGTDTAVYQNLFNTPANRNIYNLDQYEIGFTYFVKAIQFLNLQQYALFIIAIISNYLVISVIYKLKKGKHLALFSYLAISSLYLFEFNVIRQSIAVSFFIYSLPYLFERKFLKVFFFLICACFFHYSAIFLLFLYGLYILLILKKEKLAFILAILVPFVFTIMINQILFFMASNTNATKILDYQDRSGEGGGLYRFILFALITLFVWLMGYKKDIHQKFYFIILMCMLSLMLNILFFGLNYEGPGRVVVYCYVAFIFVFNYAFYNLKPKLRLVFSVLFYGLGLLYFIISAAYFRMHEVFPYAFRNDLW